jgi:hypothetical protein
MDARECVEARARWQNLLARVDAADKALRAMEVFVGLRVGEAGLCDDPAEDPIEPAARVAGTTPPAADEGGGRDDPEPPPVPPTSVSRGRVLAACRTHALSFTTMAIAEQLRARSVGAWDEVRVHLNALADAGEIDHLARGRFRAIHGHVPRGTLRQEPGGAPASEDAALASRSGHSTGAPEGRSPTATPVRASIKAAAHLDRVTFRAGDKITADLRRQAWDRALQAATVSTALSDLRGDPRHLAERFPDLALEAGRRRATTMSNGGILTRAMVLDACLSLTGNFGAHEVAQALGEDDISRIFTHLSTLVEGGGLERVSGGRYRVRAGYR